MSILRKKLRSQIRSITLHLKELQKEGQSKPNIYRRKERTKIRAEVNEIETRKIIEKINGTNN